MNDDAHRPVLLHEAIAALDVRADGVYVDATFGRGGHAALLASKLGASGRLLVFDRDPEAIAHARSMAQADARIVAVHEPFAHLQVALSRLGVEQVHGVLLDLGVSSPQIDNPRRGFSFRHDGPLDMRMDTTTGLPAHVWLNAADEGEIARVLRDYGEERYNRRVARAIVRARAVQPIVRTAQLADVVAKVVPRDGRQHPATRTFQALRIHVNDELGQVASVLPQAVRVLAVRGRLVVIAFHSLEDRIVKRFIQRHSQVESVPSWAIVQEHERRAPSLVRLGRVLPGADEVRINARARSAVMRVAQRTAGDFVE